MDRASRIATWSYRIRDFEVIKLANERILEHGLVNDEDIGSYTSFGILRGLSNLLYF